MPGTKKSGELVTPGDKLGVIEEFTPGAGTYEVDGAIYAKIAGRILLDQMIKKVSVYPVGRSLSVPQVGNQVVGSVVNVQESSAAVRIFEIGTEHLSGVFSGVLHVSDASLSYVDSMFDVCRLGDIIRAEVVSDKNGTYHLSTKGKDFGVLYAYCSKCGSILERRNADMGCSNCGNIEKRKTAIDYENATL